jgi:plasmid stabilization system protein ParE
MDYRVELSRRAECDSEEAFLYIRKRAPLNAVRWWRGLEAKLRLLEQLPESFAFAPENQDTTIPVRQFH